ncbi:serine/threonine-protein phosphatase-like protein [Trifolium pratense]|uniref:Serine/threonine-protein phosphatase-like protein n=1 Tax=Trifolium pratense TaxID=57577 RepID=A0A2K3NKM2_TRIPR|nr:serine/threonine-protein phosphatase-like protein [Trifolium pratense]
MLSAFQFKFTYRHTFSKCPGSLGADSRIRHRRGRAESRQHQGELEHDEPQDEPLPTVPEQQTVQQGWPGGPIDTSLLTRYKQHVSRYVWLGQVAERVPDQHPEIIQGWLNTSGLCWLERTSLKLTDPQLLSVFVERWHPETSSLLLTMWRVFCICLLGVTSILLYQLLRNKLQHLQLSCWGKVMSQGVDVDVGWIAALVCLYDNLNDACMFTTKALAGYATLLQCWIHEYFPSLGRRAASGLNCDEPGFPRAMRWIYKQGKTKLPEYRPIMDALTPDDVIWRQFETHRGSIPFDPITLYSGYLRGCTVVPYLPERCIRQFGYVHYVPPPPPLARAYAAIDSDLNGYHASIDRILQPTRPVTYASETTPDYLPWYYTYAPAPDAPATDAPAEDAPPETALQREQRWRGMVHGALEAFLTRVDTDRNDHDFDDLFFALGVSRGAYP